MEIMNHNRKRSRLLWTIQVVALLSIGCLVPQYVHASLEGSAVKISDAADDQQNPQVVGISNHELWFVVWEDWRNWAISGADIYGRFVTLDGDFCGDEIEILISGAVGNQTAPTVAYRNYQDPVSGQPDDKIVVVWQDTRGDSDSGFVYYRDINVSDITAGCSGYTLGAEKEISFRGTLMYTSSSTVASVGDDLRSRKLPEISYDAVNDLFWMTWVESRDSLQHISELCFSRAPANWVFGDASFPAFTKIKGGSLTEEFDNSETIGIGDGEQTNFSNLLEEIPVQPETMKVSVKGTGVLSDDGSGVLAPDSGTIDYVSGKLDVKFVTAPTIGSPISCNYNGAQNFSVGTGDGSTTRFSVMLPGTPIAANTVTVSVNSKNVLIDDGQGSLLPGFGTIDYGTGAVNAYFVTPPQVGVVVAMAYNVRFSEQIGAGDGEATDFYAVLTNPNVAQDTVSVMAGSIVLTGYTGGAILGTGGSGYVGTDGQIFVTFDEAPAEGVLVTCFYQSTVTDSLSIGNGIQTDFPMNLSHTPAVAGSVSVTLGGKDVLLDDGLGRLLSGFGTIDYTTGVIDITIIAPANAASVMCDYQGVVTDLIRNSTLRTNRLISATLGPLQEIYVYEYFTNLNNPTVAADTTSPEVLYVWEGIDQTGTMTCNCEDLNENNACDFFEPVSTSLLTEAKGDGLVHIYGLYEKEIRQPSLYSTRIDSSVNTSAYYPVMSLDPVHRKFLVAWEDLRGGDETKVYGQLIYSGGGLYNQNFIISYSDTNGDGEMDDQVAASRQTRPNISYDGTNQRFFVTWQDGRNSQVSLENLDIYGQFVDSEGSLRGENYPICIAEANQYNPATAYNQYNHQFLTVWKDARNFASTYSDIYGQRFTLGQPQLVFLNLDDTPLVPPLLDFGQLTVGQSAIQPIKLKNTGDTVVNIDCIDPMPDEPFKFSALPSQLETCDGVYLSLIPSGEYTLSIKFEPVAGGTFIEQFAIRSDANSPTVWLQGIGMGETPPNASITVSPQELNFDLNFDNEPEDTPVGETRSRNLTFINNGNIDITVSAVDLVPTDAFTIIGLGEGTVIPKGSSLITVVKFTPQQAMTYNAILDILYGPGVDPSRVYLAGTGTVDASLVVEPTSIDFGDIQIGEVSTQDITFINDGDLDITITSINQSADPAFTVSGIAANTVIPAGGSTTATITFTPVTVAAYSALLTVNYNLGLTATEISMSGNGVNLSRIGISPESILFADTKVGGAAQENLIFTNNSDADVSISSILLTNSAPFSLSGLVSGSVIQAGKTLTGVVIFNPTEIGTFTDTIKVIFSGDDQTYEIPVSGSGVMENGNVKVVATNTSNKAYEVVIDTVTDKEGWLYILTGHLPDSGRNIYAYTPDGNQTLFASGGNLEENWNTLYYSDDPQSVIDVSLGEMDLKDQAGVLYVGSFVDASQIEFDFEECLVNMLAVVVRDFSGEWEVTDTYEGKDYINPYHLITLDKDGKISASWGPYNPEISYGDGSGYTITFTFEGKKYHYTITTLTADTYEGTWYFSDGINYSPIYKTKGKKVSTTVADEGHSSADAVLRQGAWGR